MSCQLECLPLAYGLSWFFPTNDDPKERQVEIAQVWDFLAQVGYFSGSSKKTVRDFLHTADQAARMAGRLQAQLGCSEDMDLVTCLADKDTEHVMSSALNVSIETYTYGWEAFYMRQHL